MNGKSAEIFFKNMDGCIKENFGFDDEDLASETYQVKKNHLPYDYKESFIIEENGIKILVTEYWWKGKIFRTVKNRKYFYRRKDGKCSIQ